MGAINGKKRFWWAAGAAGALILAGLDAPTPASAQFALGPVLAMLSVVESVMKNTITPTLKAINSVQSNMQSFQQTVMYPENEISEFHSLASGSLGEMTSMHSLFTLPVNSATLAAPRAFESTILGANPNSIGNLGASYTKVYGALPPSTQVSAPVRTVIDMNDADAQDGDKLAVKLDAIANTEQTLSTQYMKQLGSSAPGNAALIEAQAEAMNLEAGAYTQQALDELLRLQAAEAAYRGSVIKSAATAHQTVLNSAVAQPIE